MMAVGSPIFAPHGEVLGGISVTGPMRRIEKVEEDLTDLLLDVTEDITLRIEYPQS